MGEDNVIKKNIPASSIAIWSFILGVIIGTLCIMLFWINQVEMDLILEYGIIGWLYLLGFITSGIMIGWPLFFLPSVIAFTKGKKNKIAIFMLNLLLGSTGFGWIGALIWSLCED